MKIAFSPIYHHPLPPGHRFPMAKYSLLPEQLLREGIVQEHSFFAPDTLSEERIIRTHQKEYWEKLREGNLSRQEERRTGFPWDPILVERERIICNGTAMNAEYAIADRVSFNIAGGTHHAYSNRGEGFCLLNDNAIGAHHLLDSNLAKKIIIIDLDVHQGNGTAEIFENDPRVFTFSMHGGNNYPLHKEKSDLDIPLPDGIQDKDYLKLLDTHLNRVLDQFQPDFAFYQAGVDILSTDKLGRLGVTESGCAARDRFVFERLQACRIPVAVNMGGGYSEKLSDILNAHVNTFRIARDIFE